MLNVNSAIYSSSGIDVNNVANTAGQILKEASKNQPQVQAIDYSKFNRATLGIDLYSSKTNSQLQKQIAITQAGLYIQAVDTAKLNSQAAMNLYSASTVQKNVELTQSAQVQELAQVAKVEQETPQIQLFNITDKNSHSSNGFNPFRADEDNLNKEEGEKDNLSLFA